MLDGHDLRLQRARIEAVGGGLVGNPRALNPRVMLGEHQPASPPIQAPAPAPRPPAPRPPAPRPPAPPPLQHLALRHVRRSVIPPRPSWPFRLVGSTRRCPPSINPVR